jgi:hypothetical protein
MNLGELDPDVCLDCGAHPTRCDCPDHGPEPGSTGPACPHCGGGPVVTVHGAHICRSCARVISGALVTEPIASNVTRSDSAQVDSGSPAEPT